MSNLIKTINVDSFDMIRQADVKVVRELYIPAGSKTAEPNVVAKIIVNDKYVHTFSPRSRVSQALQVMKPEDLQARLNGGSFFFINGEMIDFRDNQYNEQGGFIHTVQSIEKLIELVGVRQISNRDRKALGIKTHGELVLSGVYNTQEIVVPRFLEGGQFQASLMYNWNPFHSDVKGVFELVRVICTNGMVGLCDSMNTRVPIINDWEQNLDIAAHQIQSRIGDRVKGRLEQMDGERATVAECQQLAEHAMKRLTQNEMPAKERSLLQTIYKVVNPTFHMVKYYTNNVFGNRDVGAQMASHLSKLTAFNAATELYSHTQETDSSTGRALQLFANNMLFAARNQGKKMLDGVKNVLSSPFNDPAAAFIGKMSEQTNKVG